MKKFYGKSCSCQRCWVHCSHHFRFLSLRRAAFIFSVKIKAHVDQFIVSFSKQMVEECKTIKNFLNTSVYNHKKLLDKRNYTNKIVVFLFKYFKNNINKLPTDWRYQNIEIERLICDYISGMTDRFALKLYKEENE